MVDLGLGEFDGIGRTSYNAKVTAFAAFRVYYDSAMNFCHNIIVVDLLNLISFVVKRLRIE